MRTHRSIPSADVWLRHDRGFWSKAACSPVPLDLESTDLEVFHQSYTSSNVLQPAALSSQSFGRSGELPPGGQVQGSPSAAEICRGQCTSGFVFCRRRHACSVFQGPHCSITCFSYSRRHRYRSPLEGVPAGLPSSLAHPAIHVRSRYLVAVFRLVLHHFVGLDLFLTVLRASLLSLALTPRSSPTRPSAWPPLPPPAAVSPIKFSVLASELRQRPSPAFRDYLLSGFGQGFTVGFLLSLVLHPQATSTNMKSALLKRDVAEQSLAKEVSLGRVVSVPSPPPLPPPPRQPATH